MGQGLFSAGIEHCPLLGRHGLGHLQEQGGLADAGFAAKQYRRPWHKPVAQDMIQGPDAAFIGLMPLAGNLAQGYGRIVRIILLYSAFLLDKLKGVPFLAGRALPLPLRACRPAGAAFVY